MIAMIAASEDMRWEAVPMVLACAGFEVRETSTTDQADCTVGLHGAQGCVLTVDGGSLDRRAGSTTWNGFLSSHRAAPAVIVTRGEARQALEAAAGAAHRVLLERPVIAAAVVVVVRQASSNRRLAVCTPQRLREAG